MLKYAGLILQHRSCVIFFFFIFFVVGGTEHSRTTLTKMLSRIAMLSLGSFCRDEKYTKTTLSAPELLGRHARPENRMSCAVFMRGTIRYRKNRYFYF